MSDDRHQGAGSTSRRDDGNDALEQELLRESNEGADMIGDMNQNRQLNGSSTWATLSEGRQAGEDRSQRGETF